MTCWHTKFWHSDPTWNTFWQLYMFSELDHADPYPWLLMTVCWTNTWGHEGPPKNPFSNEKIACTGKDLGACHAPFVPKNWRKSSWCMHSYYCRQWQIVVMHAAIPFVLHLVSWDPWIRLLKTQMLCNKELDDCYFFRCAYQCSASVHPCCQNLFCRDGYFLSGGMGVKAIDHI